MERCELYIKTIRAQDGPVWSRKVGQEATAFDTNKHDGYLYNISGAWLHPNQVINVSASGNVTLETLVREGAIFYDFNQTITSDKFIKIEVRGFYAEPVTGLDKKQRVEGFVLADVVF